MVVFTHMVIFRCLCQVLLWSYVYIENVICLQMSTTFSTKFWEIGRVIRQIVFNFEGKYEGGDQGHNSLIWFNINPNVDT